MAFPSTPILDNFNRPDEGPPPSANWTVSNATGHKVISNQCGVTTLEYNETHWNTVFNEDQEAYVTYSVQVNVKQVLFIEARVQTVGDHYKVRIDDDVNTLQIIRFIEGSGDTVLTSVGISITAGDVFGIKVTGNNPDVTIEAYQNGALVASYTDNSTSRILGSGKIGLLTGPNSTSMRYDDFGGGSISSGVVVTPGSSLAKAKKVDPTTILGSLTISPQNALAKASSNPPITVLGSLNLAPSPASSIGRTPSPTTVLGSILFGPSPGTAIARKSDPTVDIGGLIITPSPASSISRKTNPGVMLGSLSISPAVANAIARNQNPGVLIPSTPSGRRGIGLRRLLTMRW